MNIKLLKQATSKAGRWQVGFSLALIAGGFVAIVKAWDGASNIDFAQGQIPYLLSGGAAGLGLILVGVALMVFEMARRDRLHLDAKLDELTKAISEMRPQTERAAVTVVPNGYVVAGAASYHRPDCRLVAGKEDQELLAPEEAAEQGLAPCRICEPAAVEPA